MLGGVMLAFVVVPVMELWLLIEVGSVFGAGPTIALVLATGVLGAAMARREGFLAWVRLNQATAQGEMPTAAMFDALGVFVGGALLLTPGILTDVLGFSLLWQPTRRWLGRRLAGWLQRRVTTRAQMWAEQGAPGPRPGGPGGFGEHGEPHVRVTRHVIVDQQFGQPPRDRPLDE